MTTSAAMSSSAAGMVGGAVSRMSSAAAAWASGRIYSGGYCVYICIGGLLEKLGAFYHVDFAAGLFQFVRIWYAYTDEKSNNNRYNNCYGKCVEKTA